MGKEWQRRLRHRRNRLRRFVPWLFVFGKWLTLLFSNRSFLRRSGYFKSVGKGRPVRADGSPIPWLNYPVIGFLENRLHEGLTLFEYGSGNSTLFYAGLVGRVVAVEHNPAWFGEISSRAPANAEILLCDPFEPRRYAEMIAVQGRRYDVVIVDGKERRRCLEIAPEWLTAGGVMLLDDANPATYGEAIARVAARGFRVLEFEGLKAGSIGIARTVLFYRPENVLGL
jgi:hypothetical protein